MISRSPGGLASGYFDVIDEGPNYGDSLINPCFRQKKPFN